LDFPSFVTSDTVITLWKLEMTTDLYTRNQGYKTISILLQDVFTAINKFRDFIYETDS